MKQTVSVLGEPEPICTVCGEIIDKNEGYTVSGDGRKWWCHEHEPQEERAIL